MFDQSLLLSTSAEDSDDTKPSDADETDQGSDCHQSQEVPRKVEEDLDEEEATSGTNRCHLDEAAATNPGFNLTRWSGVWLQSAKTRLVAWKREQVQIKFHDGPLV